MPFIPPILQAILNRTGAGGGGGFNSGGAIGGYPSPGTPYNGPTGAGDSLHDNMTTGPSFFGGPNYVEPPGAFHQAINSFGSLILDTARNALGNLFRGGGNSSGNPSLPTTSETNNPPMYGSAAGGGRPSGGLTASAAYRNSIGLGSIQGTVQGLPPMDAFNEFKRRSQI